MKRFFFHTLIGVTLTAGTMLASEVGARRENQQDRIAQGVASGQLAARETRNLEGREAFINHQIARDHSEHDGRLTARERARINCEQNVASRDIYRDKHNAFRQ